MFDRKPMSNDTKSQLIYNTNTNIKFSLILATGSWVAFNTRAKTSVSEKEEQRFVKLFDQDIYHFHSFTTAIGYSLIWRDAAVIYPIAIGEAIKLFWLWLRFLVELKDTAHLSATRPRSDSHLPPPNGHYHSNWNSRSFLPALEAPCHWYS